MIESRLNFVPGFAIIAAQMSGPTLQSFHESNEIACAATKRMVHLSALRVEPAEICFAKNGNVRMWRLLSAMNVDIGR
jgi:hypothetical protein